MVAQDQLRPLNAVDTIYLALLAHCWFLSSAESTLHCPIFCCPLDPVFWRYSSHSLLCTDDLPFIFLHVVVAVHGLHFSTVLHVSPGCFRPRLFCVQGLNFCLILVQNSLLWGLRSRQRTCYTPPLAPTSFAHTSTTDGKGVQRCPKGLSNDALLAAQHEPP